ncbi:hypothetical protein [uncultured Sphaerotilus sp.]|uniref:hypothetical protein n=1 Tax=uncultured Sphaerotilus sp. TaxID=474984 RepID=UPI0030CA213A
MNKKILIARILILGTIAVPLVVYMYVFGAKLSSNHTQWAEFGSAIGGIYSPLVALLTLAVLAKQVTLQAQMNVHESDQAYLQQAREDIEFYSTQMAQAVNCMVLPGKSLRAVLHENFECQNIAELDSQELRQLAANIHASIPPALDIWAAIYPIFMGLEAGKTRMYTMTLGSSSQKLIALLSFETCVAIDNLHRARSEGRAKVNYVFSPLLKNECALDRSV